jgi:hypothetical protein
VYGESKIQNLKSKMLNPLTAALVVVLLGGMAGVGISALTPALGDQTALLALALPAGLIVTLLCWYCFDWMMFVALACSSVVFMEPAPVDLLLILLLIVGLLNGRLSPQRLHNAPLIHLSVWLLALTNLFAMIPGGYPAPASLLFAAVSFYLLASMYLVKMYVTSPRQGHVILAGYWVAAGIAVGSVLPFYIGLQQHLTAPGLNSGQLGVIGLRARGLFKDPNVFGPFLVPLFLLVLDEWVEPTLTRIPALLKGLTCSLVVVGIFLSFSRAAWVNLGVGVVLYTSINLLRGRRIKRLLVILGSGAAVAGLLVGLLFASRPDLVNLFNWRLDLQQRYDSFRFARHQEGIMSAFTDPIGVGPGNFGGAHQLFVKTLAEQGWLGFAALLTLLFTLTARGLRTVFSKVHGLSSAAVLAGLAGTLTNSFVIDTIHWRHFYLLLGLAWAMSDGAQEAHDEP